MTRQGLLQLLAGAPLVAFSAQLARVAGDGELCLHLGPGRYTIAPGGSVAVFEHAIRIEGCTFEGCTVRIADSVQSEPALGVT